MHPAVDIFSPAAAVVVQEREVVGLDPFLLDALATCDRAGLRLQLVTPPESRLTVPLAQVLLESTGQWVVRRADGQCYDGLRGQVLIWDGSSFVAPPDPGLDHQWANPPITENGSLAVDVTVVHPAARDVSLGEAVEACLAVLANGPASGWGVAEPVSERWDREALTSYCRERAPQPSTLVVVGGTDAQPAIGTLHLTRTTAGLHERIRLSVGSGGTVGVQRLDALAERLALLPAPARTALLGLDPGRGDGTVEPRSTGATVPYGLLLGPPVVQGLGQERLLAAPVPEVALVGPAGQQSAWAHLLPAAGTAAPGDSLGRLLRHLGADLATLGA